MLTMLAGAVRFCVAEGVKVTHGREEGRQIFNG